MRTKPVEPTKLPPLEMLAGGCDFLDDLQEGIWVADGGGHIAFANRALVRILGFEGADALVGRPWRELLPAADVSRLTRGRPDADAYALGDAHLVGRDGHTVTASVSVTRRQNAGQSWYVGSAVEIAAARPAQGFSEATSRQVMENSVDGICIIEERQTVYVNRRLEELTGYSSPQLGRLTLDRLVRPRDRRVITQALTDPHRLLVPVHHEVTVINRSGQEIHCELRIVPAEADGRTVLICYLRDISQLRQAERVRTDFIAMVSHDLRTPLAAIKESISLLADTAADRLESRQRRYLSIAREEMDRLNRMIDNLIEVARMETGRVSLHLEAVDLGRLLSVALDSLSLFIGKSSLTVEQDLPPRLPPVLADADRLLRVLNNLLDNAIKYSPTGGRIRVDVRFVDPGAAILAEPGILADTGYVQVTISDQGPGIPAEFLDRIFGKFERVDPHGPGIGLGLAIVKSIVELHHGRVWARSILGEGTSFSFILPIKENS
ncbi:PAS domain S-box protein [candidate division WOR-3 bacterium]|nr:PAS domain S-box protein [candidate division WOR-3 bacterium]